MALQTNVTLNAYGQDVVVPNVHVKVGNVKGNKSSCTFNVWFFKLETGELTQFHEKEYWFAPSVEAGSDNFIKQAYDHLKTLPEFSNASEV
tara:strand:- start:123 stop:395 length:273 start_codon:yes stop_codon:yes gene_type:complete